MEKRLKKYLKDGKFTDVSVNTSKVMSAIKGKKNKSTELSLRMALIRNGINGWKLNYTEVVGKPDFYFYQHKLAIFVDGCFWHGCPECGHIPKTRSEFWRAKIKRTKERDQKTNLKLKDEGIKVLHFLEHDLQSKEKIESTIKIISSVIGDLRTT